jgi:hypothetical protein
MARSVRKIGALAAIGVLVVAASPAAAQVKPGSQEGLGLTGADVPPILARVRADPYRAPAEPACETIPQEILALDKVLGPDVDEARKKTGMGQMAVGYARGMIPYHGVVRFITGADGKDRKLIAAEAAGNARRGFLRGLEANLRCAPDQGQARAADAQVADVSDKVADIRVAEAEPAPARQAAPGDEIARRMLTPVSSVPATPAVGGAPSDSTHVVYQWVDTASGRTVVPDAGR